MKIVLFPSHAPSNGNRLFSHNGGSAKRWLEVKLVGTQSNKGGVGAQIAIKAGSVRMLREITTGVGYRSQNMSIAHFGLDTSPSVDSIIIVRWPSGSVSVLRNQSPNQRITIVEGTTGVAESHERPSQSILFQNYPNPFNPTTKISYYVGSQQHVKIEVYDELGRLTGVLREREIIAPGLTR